MQHGVRAFYSKGVDRKTQNVIWGSILTPSRKMLKTKEKLKLDKNKVKSKMVFRAYNSEGVDKNGAKCNVEFGRITKIYRDKKKRSFGRSGRRSGPARGRGGPGRRKGGGRVGPGGEGAVLGGEGAVLGGKGRSWGGKGRYWGRRGGQQPKPTGRGSRQFK